MTLVYILLVLILLAVLYFIVLQKNSKNTEVDLSKAIDTLVTVASQKLGEEKNIIQTDLSNKKDSIEKLISDIKQQLTTVEKERVGSFTGLREAIEHTTKITKELSVTTEGLKRTLSSDRLRGAFGEKVAEDLLKQSGFVIGTSYSKQETFGEGRPDFTIYLPDKTKINIDAKFPYTNIVKMSETDNEDQKKQFLKAFESDIKTKISDVSSRNYINPEDNTVDFVVVFIPNEMIFSFIYEKFPDILEQAFANKIIFAGPFSFTAILRMVRQAYDNFRYQKNVQSIITQIKIFEKEFIKYNQEFDKIGPKIDSLSKQYNAVNTTRSHKLLRVIDKIKLEKPSASEITDGQE